MAHATRPDLGLDDDNVSITSNREEFYDQGIDRFDQELLVDANAASSIRHFNLKKEKSLLSDKLVQSEMARVLVICTGGTFTMVNTEQGYVSQKGIIKRLKKFTNLYLTMTQ